MDNFRHLRTFLEFYAHFWTFSSFAQVQKRTEEFLGDQNPSKSKMSSFGLKISFIRLKNLQKKVCNFYETKSKMSNFCLKMSYSRKWKYLKYPQFFISKPKLLILMLFGMWVHALSCFPLYLQFFWDNKIIFSY